MSALSTNDVVRGGIGGAGEPACTLRVVLVDARALFRSGLRALLEEHPDIRVVGEARSLADVARVAARAHPDVVLVHLGPSDVDALEALHLLARAHAAGAHRVVVYSTCEGDQHVDAALRSGARGFVLADDRPVLLVEAIRAAATGDVLVSPALTATLLSRGRSPGTGRGDGAGAGAAVLSAREVDLVRAVALGLTNAEISAHIWISLSTVKHHLAAVQQKLGLRNRVEIAVWAWRAGLVP